MNAVWSIHITPRPRASLLAAFSLAVLRLEHPRRTFQVWTVVHP